MYTYVHYVRIKIFSHLLRKLKSYSLQIFFQNRYNTEMLLIVSMNIEESQRMIFLESQVRNPSLVMWCLWFSCLWWSCDLYWSREQRLWRDGGHWLPEFRSNDHNPVTNLEPALIYWYQSSLSQLCVGVATGKTCQESSDSDMTVTSQVPTIATLK